MPGCGKSLTAKAIAAAWELPLVRMDIGKVFSGLVGSSEQNMRTAIRTAEATAPCVLWIDEIEKGFSGMGSGDSGTSTRVLVVPDLDAGEDGTGVRDRDRQQGGRAAAGVPAQGRFDEIFFVDLPTAAERRDIWELHLHKRLRDNKAAGLGITPQLLEALADLTEGYTGAEIEQAVIAGLFDAFSDRRPMTGVDLRRAIATMVPLSVTQAEQIAAIRGWAADRAVAATSAEDRTGYTTAGPDAGTAPAEKDGSGPQLRLVPTDPTTRGEGQWISSEYLNCADSRGRGGRHLGRRPWSTSGDGRTHRHRRVHPDARRRSADRRSPTPAPWSPHKPTTHSSPNGATCPPAFTETRPSQAGPGRSTFSARARPKSRWPKWSPPSTPRTDSGCNRRY